MNKWIKLKYVATSFSTAQKQSDVLENGEYKVYGASGLVGYLDTFGADTPYIGIVKDGAGVGRTNIYNAYTSLLGTMAYIVPRNPDNTNLHFLQYAISALNLGETAGDKATIPHIYFSVYGNKYILHVPVDTQKKIATYLNQKCDKVNSLIQNVQTQIEKLKAYKQSLVTEVVTKGLDPTVPMKDSGVDWIGEIPEHWDVVKLKYITKISRGLFNHRPRNDSRLYDGEYPFIQTGDVARSDKYITTYSQTLNELGIKVSKVFPKGTITMTIAANVGDVAILNFNAYFPDSVVGFTVKDGYDENYVYYLFKALKETFVRASIANTQLNLNIERSKEIRAAISYDTQEQKRIAFHLDKKCSQIDRLVAIKQTKIEKLEQYKRSLIYEYVTGKKEVI